MKKVKDGYLLTEEELNKVREFIRTSLERDWDRHTDKYICISISNEDGMNRMDPEMYNMSEQMLNVTFQELDEDPTDKRLYADW